MNHDPKRTVRAELLGIGPPPPAPPPPSKSGTAARYGETVPADVKLTGPRADTADRERYLAHLAGRYAAGQVDEAEYEARREHMLHAVTRSQLRLLIDDLDGFPAPPVRARPAGEQLRLMVSAFVKAKGGLEIAGVITLAAMGLVAAIALPIALWAPRMSQPRDGAFAGCIIGGVALVFAACTWAANRL